jgi:hypothetical protein
VAPSTSSINSLGGIARPARQPDRYKTVSVNGAQLAYIERGSGDAVIFVHGSPIDLRI